MVPPPSRRRNAAPSAPGQLTSLATNRRRTSMLLLSPPASDSDDDEEALLSQPTMAERVVSMSQGSGGKTGAVDMPKRKPTVSTTPTKRGGAASSKEISPSNRKRKSPSNGPTRVSARLKGRGKVMYGFDEVEEEEEDENSDDDFQSADYRSSSVPTSSKRKGRRKRLRRREDSNQNDEESNPVKKLELDFGNTRKRARTSTLTAAQRQAIRWELDRKCLSENETYMCANEFREVYKQPPNNMRAAARFRILFGRDPTAQESKEMWEEYFKPWSDDWFELHAKFLEGCGRKKMKKPKDKDPAVKKRDVKKWLDEFVKKYGEISKPELPEKFKKKSTSSKQPTKRARGTRRSARVAKSEKEDVVMSDGNKDDKMEENAVKVRKPKNHIVKHEKATELQKPKDSVVKKEKGDVKIEDSVMRDTEDDVVFVREDEKETKVKAESQDSESTNELFKDKTLVKQSHFIYNQEDSNSRHETASKTEKSENSSKNYVIQDKVAVGFVIPQGKKPTVSSEGDVVEAVRESKELSAVKTSEYGTARNVESGVKIDSKKGTDVVRGIVEELLGSIGPEKHSSAEVGITIAVAVSPSSAKNRAGANEAPIVVSDNSSDEEDNDPPAMLPTRRRSRRRLGRSPLRH